MNFSAISKVLIFLTVTTATNAYKPVVLLHGILSDASSMSIIGDQIKQVRIPQNVI